MLHYLWTSELRDLKVDIANHQISFDAVRANDNDYKYSVVIDGVMGFAWVDGLVDYEGHFNTEPMHYIDLTSAFIADDEYRVQVTEGRLFNGYGFKPNLFFEISNGGSALLVEAKAVQINEKRFVLMVDE